MMMPPGQRSQSTAKPLFRMLPTWKGNLVIFGILILLVIGYYFTQIQKTQRLFSDNARYQARMVAGVIQRNAASATLSRKSIEDILQMFLENTAKFVDYLNNVAPFSESELTAFAVEAGLAGISIVSSSDPAVQGPANWLPSPECRPHGLFVDSKTNLYALARPMDTRPGCIVVGIHAQQIETLLVQVSLPKLLETLTGLAPIRYVRIEAGPPADAIESDVSMTMDGGETVAEAMLKMGDDTLRVGLEAKTYDRTIRVLWQEFAIFSALLAGLGGFFSWLLYRYQQAYVNRVRELDRELARQREDAALGLATAAIAHEIRNPLNAISMGLQRLQLETNGLAPDHATLIDALRQAVTRTNDIVTNLKRYAAPISNRRHTVHLDQLIDRVLALYREPCRMSGISINQKTNDSGSDRTVSGDPDLLAQAFENLIKNAVEAQPNGGDITIYHRQEDGFAVITITNGSVNLSSEDLGRIFEPYMTTKFRGTGLGLPIVKRILEAHGGGVSAVSNQPGTISLITRLPLSNTKGTPT